MGIPGSKTDQIRYLGAWKRLAPAILVLLSGLGCDFKNDGKSKTIPTAPEYITRDVSGLDAVRPMPALGLKDGDTLRLSAGPVKKVIHGKETRMLAYNGSIPGPLVKVPQGATITVLLQNHTGLATSLHSHGVRMASAFDGGLDTISDGAAGTYTLHFPDPGIYWYHSHEREDYSLELGMYGNYLVAPRDTGVWKPVDREIVLIVNDILTDSAGIKPYRKDGADYAMMGRFGNVFLVNGDTACTLDVKRNEVIRFFLTNACNARVLAISLRNGGTLKVVGSDNGPYEAPRLGQWEYVAPGERSVFEAYFNDAGEDSIMHVTPTRAFGLAKIRVSADSATSGLHRYFQNYDTNAHAIASIDSFRADFEKPVDKELLLSVRMAGMIGMAGVAKTAAAQHDPNGMEWEDHMGGANELSTSENTTWIIRDVKTGLENHDIHWTFKQGDRVKIRIYNDSTSMHPMPHPIHFHGQRFLVTSSNELPNGVELGWKDTYLVGRGERTEILLDASNPGEWMAHCHIAEHLEASMMFHYTVEKAAP